MAKKKIEEGVIETPNSRLLSDNEKTLLGAFATMLLNCPDVNSVLYILSLINKNVNANRVIQLGEGTDLNGDIIEGFDYSR